MTHGNNPFLQTVLLVGLLLWSPGAQSEQYTLPLFVTSTAAGSAQGVVRIANSTSDTGSVEIHAIDDFGTRSGPATFTLNASAAAEFDASDLASGNAAKGLTGGIGSASGDVRLVIDTDLRIEPSAYVRAADGTLSTMHDTVRGGAAGETGNYRYDVPVFNPSTEVTQVSRLRLINPGDGATAVTIGARDDTGANATGGTVRMTLPAGGARTLTAQQLEAGDSGIVGHLGAGGDKRRLAVTADRSIQVVNVVAASAGYRNNLSTTALVGLAPDDHSAFNERFLENEIKYATGSERFVFTGMAGDRFTETTTADGVITAYTGSYGYERTGSDAGRAALTYDDGKQCQTNLYFSSPTGGWFASRCSGSDNPDGSWLAGTWSTVDGGGPSPDPDPGGAPTHEPGDEITNLPTGAWAPTAISAGGQITIGGANTVVKLADGGYFEHGGNRYTCRSAGGCEIDNRRVVSGTIAQTSTAPMPEDTQPGSLGVCQVGMMVNTGQSCTYPGTTDAFSVNARGRGSFLGRLAGIRIQITDETIDGREYDFEASHQGEGVWRIGRVAGSTGMPTGGTGNSGTGPAVSSAITQCSGDPLFPGSSDHHLVRVRGTVRAGGSVSNVRVTGYANGVAVGTDSLGSMPAGESRDFAVVGVIETAETTLSCTVEVAYTAPDA